MKPSTLIFASSARAACLAALFVLAAVARGGTIRVAADGTGDFTTVQSAVDSVPVGNSEPVQIVIKPGVYKERIHVRKGQKFITFRGDSSDPRKVVLTYDLNANSVIPPATKPVGTSGSTSTLIDADDFTAENVTFANSAGDRGQAVAIKINADRVIFRNCRFLGWQDTLYPNGYRNYFADCYIEGRVDFIFGKSTAVFERCHIHSKNGGFVTAASTFAERPFGFVFLDCKLTGEGEKAYLGRPWKPHAAVAFIRCQIGPHIRPEGWDNWGNPDNEKTARYVEFGNTGPGANTAKRVPWARQLTKEQAAEFTVENILGGDDGWRPDRKTE